MTGRRADDEGEAFALFFRCHHRDVWKMSCFYLKDHHEAEDAVQETFLKAWSARSRCRAGSAAHPWLLAICRNVCIDRLRRRPRNGPPESLDEGDRHELGDPRRAGADEDLRIDLRRAVAHLGAQEREAWFLVDVLGFTSHEAAKIVRAPAASTVRSRLARARRDLAEELTEAPRETLDGVLASDVHGLYHSSRANAIVVSVVDPVAQHANGDRARWTRMSHGSGPGSGEPCVLRQSYLRLYARLEAKSHSAATVNGSPCPDLFDFLERLERDVPRDRRMLALVETAPNHNSDHADRWSAAHPRWSLHGTPCHRTWQQAVEELFAEPATNGNGRGPRRMLALIDAAEPFVWTAGRNGSHR